MKIETLEYILVTAQYSTISNAADKLFLSQTTLSTAIKAAEAEIGFEIFERNPKGIVLTEQGEEFISLATPIIQSYYQILSLASKTQQRRQQICAHPVASNRYSVALIKAFSEFVPNASLSVIEAPRNKILDLISKGKFNIGIGYAYLSDVIQYQETAEQMRIHCEMLSADHNYVYVNAKSKLANLKAVGLENLKNEWLALSVNGVLEYNHMKLYRHIPQYSTFGNIYLMREAIEQNNMVAFYMSNSTEKDWFTEGTSIRKLALTEELSIPSRHCLLYRADKILTENELHLIECIRSVLSP